MPKTQTSFSKTQLFLVGFMASGKSTVGPLLAARLGRPFIDLDQHIEAHAGYTIFELIKHAGEARFRELETQILAEFAHAEPAVIAPGGGAITREENRVLMQQTGVQLWLDASFELCWQRIQHDGVTRPLAPDEATARARYEQRLSLYQQADVRVAVRAGQSATELVDACMRQLQQQ